MRKKMLFLAMAVALSFWAVPASALEPSAQEPSKEYYEAAQPSQEEAVVESAPETDGGTCDSDTSDLNAARIVDEGAEGEALEVKNDSALYSALSGSYIYQVNLEQKDNGTIVEVTLPNFAELVSTGKADRVRIEANMNYRGVITRSAVMEKTVAELSETGGAFDLDYGTYGKFSVTAYFYKGDTLVKTGDIQTMGVVADEYNIAPVSASLPVAFFSLSLWGGDKGIRYDGVGNVIPTIMLMERPNAWNWDSVPEGVYELPYIPENEFRYQPNDFSAASNLFRTHSWAMVDYVADLYEMNPNATFNLYLVDYYLGLVQSILYANGIPEGQYSINVLSDGAMSYSLFGDAYYYENPTGTHQELMEEWQKAKREAYSSGAVSEGFTLWQPNTMVYAAVDSEPSARWWLAQPSLLASASDGNVFGKAAQADDQVVKFAIAAELANLQNQGDESVREFKSLYNFSDTYFADAGANGKDVMLFIGAKVTSEGGSFSDYARFTMAYYGDKFEYYYKGHPASPTELNPEKQAELEKLGVTDVDSSVAAELILFFYPDIYLSGYQTSVYQSLPDSDMAKGLFRTTKASGSSDPVYSVMDWYISPVDANTAEAMRVLCKEGDANYLVEFSDSILPDLDYDIAIWNATMSLISYYAYDNGSYTLVRTSQADGSSVEDGLYALASKGAQGKVVDIASASASDYANAQIYDSNESSAQRYRVANTGDGFYAIQNVGSNKMLDVSSAGVEPGTNVQQYSDNGTDAQKWQLVETKDGDGSYYLVSKCNGLYLDCQWAGTQNGTNLHVYTGNSSDAQKFWLNKIEPVVGNGSYVVSSSLSKATVLDIAGGSHQNEANAQIYASNGTDAQIFDFAYDSATGYYAIKNHGSGKALDVMWAGVSSGTNVWQYDVNDSTAQKWSIKMSGGSYILYSATGQGCCLDLTSANTSNGSNVQIWEPNGTGAQKWVLSKV